MINRNKVFMRTKGICYYCGCELDFDNFHADHKIPKSRGGKDGDNLVPACPDCNLSKGDKSIDEWRESLEKFTFTDNHCRMMKKFYRVEPQNIVFWFEKQQVYEDSEEKDEDI